MTLSLFAMVSGSLFQSGIVLQKKEYLKLSFLQGSCLNVFECEVLVFDWFGISISVYGISIILFES